MALADLGYVYAAQGRERAALDIFHREVTLQPSNSQSWLDHAKAYVEQVISKRKIIISELEDAVRDV